MSHTPEVDDAEIVDQTMDVFWTTGFHETSFDDLQRASGLSRARFFNTYGSKFELFLRALDAYTEGPIREFHRPLYEQRGADALRGYLDWLSAYVRAPDGRRGCLMVNTSVTELHDEDITTRTRAHFSEVRAAFRRAYTEGLDDQTVNSNLVAEEASDWLITFVRGVLASIVAGEGIRTLVNSIESTKSYIGV